MQEQKEYYRQFMIGQLQRWQSTIGHLKAGAPMYSGYSRSEYESRLSEIERCQRTVFVRFEDMLLAGTDEYEDTRTALDASAYKLQEMFDQFTLQPA